MPTIRPVDIEVFEWDDDMVFLQLFSLGLVVQMSQHPHFPVCVAPGMVGSQYLHGPPLVGVPIQAQPDYPEAPAAQLMDHLEPAIEKVADIDRVEPALVVFPEIFHLLEL
ncbi:hypothetical protein DL766_010332 [Monosporascus sp. MC13-8B]|uniref:CN hydrolase domain-containing protein n=1 Tax=Monosporascus cannonballus TaxID=155416 RepID=A0ABY0GU94_9PEZI|nr:hypothetical protein DL762_009435 [Monosporascus cannonballus]RYO79081.1 hypothetical protein DL763_009422 [Monosporascus cannonballus]RYP02505.1 hypothetical protein DL766_010332 [Monosporascus sp. MC13-8B]